MPEIIDLRELIPEDLEFVFPAEEAGGEPVRLSMPGDLPNETTWEIFRLLIDVADLETDLEKKEKEPAKTPAAVRRQANQALAQLRGIEDRLEAILLETFRIRQPDVEALPCGKKGAAIVAEAVLKHIGFLAEEAEEEDGEEGPTVGGSPTGGGSSTSRSSRSSKSSGSPRTRGGGSATGKRKRGSTSENAG